MAKVYQVLALLAMATLIGGGYTFMDPDQSTTHHEVILKNEDESAHHVAILIKHSEGDVVHNETREVSPGEEWKVTTQTEPGNYTIKVVPRSGGEKKATYSLPLADGDRKSYTTVRVRSTGEVDIRSYWQE